MEIKELVSRLTYEHLSRGLLIGGTATFLYLFYEICLANTNRNKTVVMETSADTDYTTYFKGNGET